MADPETGDLVTVEIHQEPVTGALVGVDTRFAELTSRRVASPFDSGTILELAKPPYPRS